MAFPSIAGTPLATTQAAATATRDITIPSGVVAGEMLIAAITTSNGSAVTFTPPAGWSAVTGAAVSSTDSNGDAFWKIADGTEGGTTVTTTASGSSTNSCACCYRISGADGATAPEAISTSGAGTSPNPPSLSPSWGAADTLWIAEFGKRAAATFGSYPANYTLGQVTGNISGCRTAMAARELNTASEDPGAFSIGSAVGWQAMTIAVKPGASSIAAGTASGAGTASAVATATAEAGGTSAGVGAAAATSEARSTGVAAGVGIALATGEAVIEAVGRARGASVVTGIAVPAPSEARMATVPLVSRVLVLPENSREVDVPEVSRSVDVQVAMEGASNRTIVLSELPPIVQQ